MKKHMLTVHGRLKVNKSSEMEVSSLVCDNCGYKASEKTRLMQHIEAVHVNSWRSQIVQNVVETSEEEEHREESGNTLVFM